MRRTHIYNDLLLVSEVNVNINILVKTNLSTPINTHFFKYSFATYIDRVYTYYRLGNVVKEISYKLVANIFLKK